MTQKKLTADERFLIALYRLQESGRRLAKDHGRSCSCQVCRVRRGSRWMIEEIAVALEDAIPEMGERAQDLAAAVLARRLGQEHVFGVPSRKRRRQLAHS